MQTAFSAVASIHPAALPEDGKRRMDVIDGVILSPVLEQQKARGCTTGFTICSIVIQHLACYHST